MGSQKLAATLWKLLQSGPTYGQGKVMGFLEVHPKLEKLVAKFSGNGGAEGRTRLCIEETEQHLNITNRIINPLK